MRILTLVLSLIITSLNIQAQSKEEPKNNLNKTLEQLQITFPNLQYWGADNNVVRYKYEDNMLFELKNNRVISEFMTIEGEGNYPYDWYTAMTNAFYKTNYTHILKGDTGNTFIYSYFSVYINYSNRNNTASIMYDLLPKYK